MFHPDKEIVMESGPKEGAEKVGLLNDATVRRMISNELKSGRGTEIYTLDDNGTGKPIYFDISSMREWASKNLEIFLHFQMSTERSD
jgi:hypothetical protein